MLSVSLQSEGHSVGQVVTKSSICPPADPQEEKQCCYMVQTNKNRLVTRSFCFWVFFLGKKTCILFFFPDDRMGLALLRLPASHPVRLSVIHLPIQSVNQWVELHLEFNTKQQAKQGAVITPSATQDNECNQGSLPAQTWLTHTRHTNWHPSQRRQSWCSFTYLQQLCVFSDDTSEGC